MNQTMFLSHASALLTARRAVYCSTSVDGGCCGSRLVVRILVCGIGVGVAVSLP